MTRTGREAPCVPGRLAWRPRDAPLHIVVIPNEVGIRSLWLHNTFLLIQGREW